MFELREMLERFGSYVIPLMLSLTVHEWAHAWSANLLGDDTAERQGRLTLNPLAHIDPLGSVILPLLGVGFGWARPVPVVASRFRRTISMQMGNLIASGAGPLSNLVLALLSAVLFGLGIRLGVGDERMDIYQLLQTMMSINVLLTVLNMLPIAPLDGTRVVEAFVPYRWRHAWDTYCQYGPMLLLALLLVPSLFGFSVLAWPTAIGMRAIMSLARLVAGV